MKNALSGFCMALLLLSSFLTSCTKEKSFEEQLIGHWQSQQVKISGVEASSTSKVVLKLTSEKKFTLEISGSTLLVGNTTQKFTGTWEKDPSDDNDIMLTFDTNGQKSRYEIDTLEDDSMDADIIVGGVLYEIVFERR
jgi:hypothetical protein